MGPSWRQEGPKSRKAIENTTGRPPLESQVGTKNSLKIGPEAYQKVIIFLIGCGVGFCCHLVPTWLQLGRQNLPQIDPSWLQDPSKIGSGCQPICGLIFDRPWTLFCEFCFEVGRPRDQKTFQSVELSANLVFCAMSGIWPTRGHMIDFFGQLGSQLGTQNQPKIDPRGSQDR